MEAKVEDVGALLGDGEEVVEFGIDDSITGETIVNIVVVEVNSIANENREETEGGVTVMVVGEDNDYGVVVDGVANGERDGGEEAVGECKVAGE
ncbi:hypothetical protein Fmac_029705 [Flemingia macrophylla]|uniref:Uncharacterized protein n=1 Tax=Flemingia macrophylla TaxID=520843 RepID=A0ABD1LB86_9FABA